MKRRAAGLLLILAMVLSLLPAAAFADAAGAVGKLAVVTEETVKTGGSVTVQIKLTENPGIAALRLTVTYPDGFTMTDVRQGEALSGANFTEPGGEVKENPVQFVWDSLTNSEDTGTLVELTFSVAENAVLGEQKITVSCNRGNAADQDMQLVTLAAQTATVKVICGHSNETVLPAVAATCTKSGLTAGSKCVRCGEILTAQQEIPALGHEFGTESANCARCDVTVTRIAISAQPTTRVYALNRGVLDVTGGKVERTFSDGTADEIDMTGAMVSGFDNTKAGQQTLTVTCNGQTATYQVTVKEMAGVSVSGTVTSFGDAGEKVTVTLLQGETEIATTETTSGSYSFAGVTAGQYTLRVSKKNHATREYALTVGDADTTQDAKIHLLGDVTGDGKISATDKKMIYNHLNDKTKQLEGYIALVGDVSGDGKISATDKKMIYRHLNGDGSLWK